MNLSCQGDTIEEVRRRRDASLPPRPPRAGGRAGSGATIPSTPNPADWVHAWPSGRAHHRRVAQGDSTRTVLAVSLPPSSTRRRAPPRPFVPPPPALKLDARHPKSSPARRARRQLRCRPFSPREPSVVGGRRNSKIAVGAHRAQDALLTRFSYGGGRGRQHHAVCIGRVDLPRRVPAERWWATTKRTVDTAAAGQAGGVVLPPVSTWGEEDALVGR